MRSPGVLAGGTRSLDSLLDERGGLAGPFNAWVHHPDLGMVVQGLGERLRFRGTLPGRGAREIAILTVGAKWMAEFEWWAHVRVGRREGVSDETIDAIRRGERPRLPDPAEQAAYDLTAALLETGPGWIRRSTTRPVRSSATAASWSSSPLAGYYTLVAFTPQCVRCGAPGPGSRTPSGTGSRFPEFYAWQAGCTGGG